MALSFADLSLRQKRYLGVKKTVCGARFATKKVTIQPFPAFSSQDGGLPMSFALLKDPASEVQVLVRNDHVSAVEIKKVDQAVVVHLVGGQTLQLNPEQSKQFVHHIKTHMQLAA